MPGAKRAAGPSFELVKGTVSLTAEEPGDVPAAHRPADRGERGADAHNKAEARAALQQLDPLWDELPRPSRRTSWRCWLRGSTWPQSAERRAA
jgi:hypothetical protein